MQYDYDLKNNIENKTKQFEALIAADKEKAEMLEAVLKDRNVEINTFEEEFKVKEKEIKVLINENNELKV